MSDFNSAIQTLTDGLVFCKEYLKNNPNASDQDKAIKHQQIAEHEKAINVLIQANELSKSTDKCNLGDVIPCFSKE